MRTIETTVYKFAELSDKAKEKARDWYRQGCCDDSSWYESVYEDAATIADIIGIDLRQRAAKLMGGGTRMEPAIYFSGFSSQGDGACFEGTYRYRKGSVKAIKAHAPQDAELHRIAEELYAMQRRARFSITAQISHRGHYNHSGCMSIDVDQDMSGDIPTGDIEQCMRDFADWIYKQLETEYDYQNSDEQVDDAITANEYEFDEEGERV